MRSALLRLALVLAPAALGACSTGSHGWYDRRPDPIVDGVPPPTYSSAPRVVYAPRVVAVMPSRVPVATPTPAPAPVRVASKPIVPVARGGGMPACAPAPATDVDEGLAMFAAANRQRASYGLRPLVWNERLHRAAYDHSAEQARYGYLGHGSPDAARDDLRDRERIVGYEPQKWAEVVGSGYRNAEHVTQGWMDSRGHREILLDPELLDAGFARVGTYFTGDFGVPMYASRR